MYEVKKHQVSVFSCVKEALFGESFDLADRREINTAMASPSCFLQAFDSCTVGLQLKSEASNWRSLVVGL